MEPVQKIWRNVLSHNVAVTDEKKHKIIEATIHLIAKNGIGAVTFEHLGGALKTTKANIKYHFGDKNQLIFTATKLVVLNAQMLTARLVEEVATPEEKLGAIVDGAYEWFQRFPEHATVWLLFMYYAQMNEDYANFFVETRAVGRDRIQILLRGLPHSGHKTTDYGRLAEGIQNILYGEMIGLTGNRKEVKQSRLMAIELISLLLKSKGIEWSKKR